MARWDPGAEERLKRAALELYLERGYDNVTVTHIAERAGLTRRSLLPLLPGQTRGPVRRLRGPAPGTGGGSPGGRPERGSARCHPRRAGASRCPARRASGRRGGAPITEAIRDALKQRQVNAGTAELVAQLATVAFQNAFRHWIEAKGNASFGSCLHAVTNELRAALART